MWCVMCDVRFVGSDAPNPNIGVFTGLHDHDAPPPASTPPVGLAHGGQYAALAA